MTEPITPKMLREAYIAIHRVQNGENPDNHREGLSQAYIAVSLLYPLIIGYRPGDDLETIERL